MMAALQPEPPSLQGALLRLRDDWLGCELLTQMGADVDALAQQLVLRDPYGENAHLLRALARTGHAPETELIRRHLAHRLWCEARNAQWIQGKPLRPLEHQVEDAHWYEESIGHPTLLVLPMTLAQPDGLDVIRRVLHGRRCIVYGEGVDADAADGIEVAGSGTRAVRRINDVLAAKGILCTYADFAYANHATLQSSLFGVTRPIAHGFVSLAQREGVHLLPVSLSVNADRTSCACRFFEGLRIAPAYTPATPVTPAPHGTNVCAARSERHARAQSVADLIAELLEQRIADNPWQWLLLPTLAFETHQ